MIKKFVPYLGKNIDDIKEYFGMDLNKKNNKGYHAGITKRILGMVLYIPFSARLLILTKTYHWSMVY